MIREHEFYLRIFHFFGDIGQRQFSETILIQIPNAVVPIERDSQHAAMLVQGVQGHNRIKVCAPAAIGNLSLEQSETGAGHEHRGTAPIFAPTGGSFGATVPSFFGVSWLRKSNLVIFRIIGRMMARLPSRVWMMMVAASVLGRATRDVPLTSSSSGK